MELGFFRQIESKDLNFLRKDFGDVVTEKKQQCRQNPNICFSVTAGCKPTATKVSLLRSLGFVVEFKFKSKDVIFL